MSLDEFKLSFVLQGHSLDVRAIAVNHENCIVSGSRDKTCKFWKPNSHNSGYTDVLTYKGHKNYVSSVCCLNPTPEYPNGLIVSGGNDNNICVYTPTHEEPIISVQAHSNTVCCVSQGNNPNTLLTSSWDCTAKLWTISHASVTESVVFKYHEVAVWSVIQLPNGNVVTGSADKDIIIWLPNGKLFKLLKGHTDCVRDLTVLNNFYFISVANDASIKVWTFEGECLETYYGHGNYIYSISVDKAISDNCFVTSGEDRVVKFWKNGENTQTLTLPAQSVWAVACLSNGDIVTGSSDGLVRIFTKDPERVADEDTLKIFEEEVAHLDDASSKEIGGYKISDLPGREVLYEPGRTDGQTKLVREDASVICYSWSAAEGTWQKVGNVLGASGGTQATSGKTLYEGKEYDFVFSVDFDENKAPLKLPYNKDQDPWHAAQAFIHKNDLPQVYLDQVANFIIQNSGAVYLQQTAQTTGYVDPFTGASRYLPGNSVSSNRTGSGSDLDPFTGESSYRTTNTSLQKPASDFADHVTDSKQINAGHYFPQLHYLKFEQGNVTVILEKLREFNKTINETALKIGSEQFEGITNLATENYSNTVYIHLLMQLLNWPADIVFPALDITRLCIRHAQNNFVLCSHENGDSLLRLLSKYLRQDIAANRMLSLRILCNMFCQTTGEALLLSRKESLLADLAAIDGPLNKNTQIALSTLLLNTTVCLVKHQDSTAVLRLVEMIAKAILNSSDPEAEFRGLVAMGTALSQFELTSKNLENVEVIPKVKEKLESISNSTSTDAVQIRNINCVRELNKLFK